MIQCIFPASHIQCITVCQKYFSAQLFHHIRHCFGIIRAKKCKIAQFSEMYFYGRIFIGKINVSDACRQNQTF